MNPLSSSFTILFVLLCCLSFSHCWWEEDINERLGFDWNEPFACWNSCALPITWISALGACGLDGGLYFNFLGNGTLSSYLQCLIKNLGLPNPNVGIAYPGSCGCPNFCSNITSNGICYRSACFCNRGWVGTDCSQVTVDNSCNGVGVVKDISGVYTCECNQGYALNDCSASMDRLPPIIQTVEPVQQYTSKDHYGDNNPIFNTSTIAQIHLTMPPEVLTYQQNPDNRQSQEYFPVKMWFYNGATLEEMDQVGFRLKGGASRNYVKKTFKLSFNKFVDGRKWAQQKKLELKALQQDVSAIKEALCLSLLYSLNAPAQRYGYAQLFINGQNMGIYLMIENVDDQYLDSRFGNDDGALYKCVGDLAYLGWDPALYQNLTVWGGKAAYEPKTDAAEDFRLLRDFIKIINVTSDQEFVNLLPTIFDVDLYVRTLAMEVLTGNWDGLWNGNNYYLYYNPDLQKFQYFRHDTEISFGVWETLYPMSTKPIYTWGDGGRGYRLINRILANEPFRSQFTLYCYELINKYFNLQGEFIDRMKLLNTELRPLILRDQWRSTDFAYSYDEFVNSPIIGIHRKTGANWVEAGTPYMDSLAIIEFMKLRIESALAQLD